jgi:hypothetical protein
MIDPPLLSPGCRDCQNFCGGLAKKLLTIDDLTPVPVRCFINEVDLSEGDKRVISNPRREGWQVALIDCLKESELIHLQHSVGSIDTAFYTKNQRTWVETALHFWREQNKRDPTAGEIEKIYAQHNARYRAEFMLLFPEMTKVNPKATEEGRDKLRKFLGKADEIVAENIKQYGYIGACHLFRIQMAKAHENGKLFVPSYTAEIMPQHSTGRRLYLAALDTIRKRITQYSATKKDPAYARTA